MASRKLFLGYAHGLAQRFVHRNNDVDGYWGVGVLSKYVHDAGLTEVEFGLLENVPDEHLPTASGSRLWLQTRLTSNCTPVDWLTAANLHITWTPRESNPSEELWPARIDRPTGAAMYRVVATASLTDDSGRVRAASAVTWCWDHDPSREGRRA